MVLLVVFTRGLAVIVGSIEKSTAVTAAVRALNAGMKNVDVHGGFGIQIVGVGGRGRVSLVRLFLVEPSIDHLGRTVDIR